MPTISERPTVDLPAYYPTLKPHQRREVREAYMERQGYVCLYCKSSLLRDPPKGITDKPLDMSLFPEGFLDAPHHLHHDHNTGLTIGTVHGYCNGVLWQYEGE